MTTDHQNEPAKRANRVGKNEFVGTMLKSMISGSDSDKDGRSQSALVSVRHAPTVFVSARTAYMQREKMTDLAAQWFVRFCQAERAVD